MADSLKVTSHQSSDMEAASGMVYAAAADEVLGDPRTLGRDTAAVSALILVVITYHLQNPLILHELQFGKAWRNESLQIALVIGLVSSVYALIRSLGRKLPPGSVAAAGVLVAYCVYITLAVVLRINVLGVVFGIPQEIFLDRVRDETLIPALQNALNVSTVLEWLAILAIVWLLAPWGRVPLYVKAVRKNSTTLLVGLAVLALWEGLIILFNVQEFLLPRPSVIGTTFIDIYPRLISVGWNTFQNAFWGFVVGCGAGILTGFASARFTSFSKALLPLAIAANSVPIIAFAPIMNFWFGALNPASKIAIAAVLTYFPAMISTVKGLTTVENTSLELMKSYAATNWEIFRKLRFPNAMPFIFSALKVSTTLSMIAAIVSEYFGGSTQGLGYRIREDAALFKYPESWSAILVASLLGIGFYLLVSTVERAVMPWFVSFREER